MKPRLSSPPALHVGSKHTRSQKRERLLSHFVVVLLWMAVIAVIVAGVAAVILRDADIRS